MPELELGEEALHVWRVVWILVAAEDLEELLVYEFDVEILQLVLRLVDLVDGEPLGQVLHDCLVFCLGSPDLEAHFPEELFRLDLLLYRIKLQYSNHNKYGGSNDYPQERYIHQEFDPSDHIHDHEGCPGLGRVGHERPQVRVGQDALEAEPGKEQLSFETKREHHDG